MVEALEERTVPSVTLTVGLGGPPTAQAGAQITYTFGVSNSGPDDAQNVNLIDQLPSGVSFVSQAQQDGSDFTQGQSGGQVTDTIAALPAGATADFVLIASVSGSTPDGSSLADQLGVITASDLAMSSVTSATVTTTAQNSGGQDDAGTTSLTLTSSGSPSAYGQSVTFTAVVSSAAGGTPTGTVTFTDGGTTLGAATLAVVNGQDKAVLDTAGLSVGSHDIAASYNGDDTFDGSTADLTEVVQHAATATTVTTSLTPSTVGQDVTFTATVAFIPPGDTVPAAPGVYPPGGAPTGSITFYDGNTALGTSTLAVVNGVAQAALDTSGLSLGSHTITAVYYGDSSFASSSDSLTQDVQVPTATVLMEGSSLNPSITGQDVTFTAVVSSTGAPVDTGGGYPYSSPNAAQTGTVTFFDGNTALGTVPLDASYEAALDTAGLSAGSHTITAVYSGDETFGSSSAALTQVVVTPADLAVTIDGPTDAIAGDTVTYTLTVTNNGAGDAQNVTLTDPLPGGVYILDQSQADGPAFTLSDDSSQVTDTIATLTAGSSATITVLAWVDPSIPNGTIFNNVATVSSDTPDPDTSNNTASTGLVVGAHADLAVGASAPDTVAAGDTLTTTITVANNGPGDAQNVTLNFALPSGTTFIAQTQTGGGSEFTLSNEGNELTDAVDTLPAGMSATFIITAQVDASLAVGTTLYPSAAVSSSTSDPDTSNNYASVSTTVIATDTVTALTSSADPASFGQAVTFTAAVVSVAGGTPTGTVTFTDTDGTVLGTATLSVVNGSDEATLATAALAVGSHTITATYGGDGNFAGSSATMLQVIVPGTTLVWNDAAGDHMWTTSGNLQTLAGIHVAITPTGTDDVLFDGSVSRDDCILAPSDGSYSVPEPLVNSLTLNSSYTGTLHLAVTDDVNIGSGGIVLENGDIEQDVGEPINDYGDFDWTGGNLNPNSPFLADLNLKNGKSANVSGDTDLATGDNINVNKDETVIVSLSDPAVKLPKSIFFSKGAGIDIKANGTLNWVDGNMRIARGSTAGNITNAGTLLKTKGLCATARTSLGIANSGTFQLQSGGTIVLDGSVNGYGFEQTGGTCELSEGSDLLGSFHMTGGNLWVDGKSAYITGKAVIEGGVISLSHDNANATGTLYITSTLKLQGTAEFDAKINCGTGGGADKINATDGITIAEKATLKAISFNLKNGKVPNGMIDTILSCAASASITGKFTDPTLDFNDGSSGKYTIDYRDKLLTKIRS